MRHLYSRISIPRGTLTALLASLALAWGPWLLQPSSGLAAPIAQTVFFGALTVVTVVSRRAKVAIVRVLQRYLVNPLVRILFGMGLNPLGLMILETRGRVSGRPRRTPVGNGRSGNDVWVIAEHGESANYVRNIRRDPRVRVRIRCGLRYRWLSGIATVLPDDDVLARQRRIVRWHPLRAFNALNVRLLGTDLVTVHIALDATPATDSAKTLGGGLQAGPVVGPPGGVLIGQVTDVCT